MYGGRDFSSSLPRPRSPAHPDVLAAALAAVTARAVHVHHARRAPCHAARRPASPLRSVARLPWEEPCGCSMAVRAVESAKAVTTGRAPLRAHTGSVPGGTTAMPRPGTSPGWCSTSLHGAVGRRAAGHRATLHARPSAVWVLAWMFSPMRRLMLMALTAILTFQPEEVAPLPADGRQEWHATLAIDRKRRARGTRAP